MATKMSQKEYLKKYLSGDKKKKKKDKKLKAKATVKIIDDDVHGSNNLEIDEELLLTGEDAPQIVGVVDAFGETPENKWKSIGGIKKEEKSDDDLWGKKADNSNEDRHQIKKKTSRATDQSPPRNVKSSLPVRRSSDQSPPRRGRIRGERVNEHNSIGEKRSRWNSDVPPTRDQSPPKKQSQTRPRRDSDQSPPRKRSPTRSRRDSDQSPPRKRSPTRSRRDSDQSPPRKRSPTRSRRDSDQSPPRRRSPTRSRRDSDQSPRRKISPTHSKRVSDQSPPRRRSPDHRKKRDSHHSPVRRHTAKNSDHLPHSSSRIQIKRENSSDQSPPRRTNNGNPFKTSIKLENTSPKRRTDSSSNQERRNRSSESPPPTHKPPSSSSKMSRTLDGKRAGLQDAQTLKIETEERRRNEELMFSNMSKEISGRDAEVQVRKNSSYRRRRNDVEEDPEVQRKKAEHEEKKKELYSRWNKGVKQIEAFKAKISDEQYEGSKPLARYSNDEDLDEMLRQKEREDDPMLEYIRSKKKDQQLAANVPVMPKYKGSYPENRFGIPPGYRWDGVDRSNGYEQKWFDVQNAKVAGAEEAYKYSVEDM